MIDDWTYHVHQGDCLNIMAEMPDDSVDLIVTSPPYAMKRKETYGGVPASEYVGWWMDRAKQMRRILKPTGSLVLNIKEGTSNRHRETYVLKLILAMVEHRWRWIDEYIWQKKTVMPGSWPERLKDGWERLLHFAPGEHDILFLPDAVRVPAKQSAINRYKQAIKHKETGRRQSRSGSGFGKDYIGAGESMYRRERKNKSGFGTKDDAETLNAPTALPDNIITCAPATTRKVLLSSGTHPAVFPDAIPEFFIRLMTYEKDVVLDPFSGSGTTYKVAQKMGRKPIGIEIKPEYIQQPDGMLFDAT